MHTSISACHRPPARDGFGRPVSWGARLVIATPGPASSPQVRYAAVNMLAATRRVSPVVEIMVSTPAPIDLSVGLSKRAAAAGQMGITCWRAAGYRRVASCRSTTFSSRSGATKRKQRLELGLAGPEGAR